MTGYSVWKQAVFMWSALQIAEQGFRPWRNIWTPHSQAVVCAENLCGEIEDYLCGTLNGRIRDTEDFDLDDFIDHLHARINNELH